MLYLRNTVVDILNEWLDTGEDYRDEVVNIYNALTPPPRGYKLKRDDPFTVACMSAAFKKAGYTNIFPMECSLFHLVPKAISAGIWTTPESYTPGVGDVVIYTKHSDKIVGIVKSITGNTLTVIEGSTDVMLKCDKVKTNSSRIEGYICPKYNYTVDEPVPAVEAEAEVVAPAEEPIELDHN